MTDNHLWKLQDNQVVLARGQIVHLANNSRWSGYRIDFDDHLWEKASSSASNCKSVLFDHAAFNQTIPLQAKQGQELDNLCRCLHAEFTKHDYLNKNVALAASLKIVIIKIANVNAATLNGFSTAGYKDYRSFYDLIIRNEIISHGVEVYAEILRLPARTLTALCKRYSGKGAKELIRLQLMNEAKRALQFTYQPVKQIAYQLKFSGPEQFSQFFK